MRFSGVLPFFGLVELEVEELEGLPATVSLQMPLAPPFPV
jgi:hypothetical protein